MSRLLRLVRLAAALERAAPRLDTIERHLDDLLLLQGATLARSVEGARTLGEAEFRIFSQFGEDGIIQHLVRALDVPRELQTFVEIGVENYTEANTRFLLRNDNWRGLVVDGGADHVAHIRSDSVSWLHDLTAVEAFVTAETIDAVIADNGFAGEIGLLSIDVDGVDYWLLDSLTVSTPLILVAEYNSVFGPAYAVSVPYRPDFERGRAHFSHLYWGASLKALTLAAGRKGLALVGSNSAGNNAFFVRRDRLGPLAEITPEQAWVESRFRDSRDEAGRLTYVAGSDRLRLIEHLPVVDVETGRTLPLADLPSD